jgi:hypothetical protein
MGVCTDIMHDFVLKEIKRIYSSYDGWTVTSRSKENDYDSVFRLERLYNYHREIVKAGVTFAKEVSPGLLETIKKPERSSDGIVSRFDYSIIAPANADTSSLPAEVTIYRMQSFAFDGDNLVWVKKPVRKTPSQPAGSDVKQAA